MAREPSDLIVGRHPVAEALRAGVAVRHVYLAEGMRPSTLLDEIVDAARHARIPVDFETRANLDRRMKASLGPGSHGAHQGVVAEATPFRYQTLAGLLEHGATRLVMAEGITDPANLGSILRSADAFGWQGVLIPEHRAVGVTPSVRKVAAGAAERVPVVRTGSPAATIRLLQERHEFGVFGLEPTGSLDYRRATYPDRICLVVGAEGHGLSRLVRERCDELVRIPMHGALASINAAVAAAIVMAAVAPAPQPAGDPRIAG
ncbi:MAG: TrmH family RNA methyltransferase [Actinomycetota bacterium]